MSERRRLFHERAELEERQQRGDPILFDEIPRTARGKIARWILDRLCPRQEMQSDIVDRLCRSKGVGSLDGWQASDQLWRFAHDAPVPEFWSMVEAAADVAAVARRTHGALIEFLGGIHHLNVLFGDEFLGYRIAETEVGAYDIRRIDNELLHREVVDRTFEITRHAEFVTANADYAEAWKHYSKGDFDDAIVNAGKALESAQKVLLRKLDANADVNQPAAKLTQALFDAGVLPAKLETCLAQVRAICAQTVPPLRNAPGVGHGSADLTGPEAALALLVLNLTGSIIVFLVQAYERR